ncbi:Mitochondrial protein cyt-4 [Escovopsis weberi]|uniref:Mitochondrial protein cyt-4 n=1 Tax=Escovopsis weberi TaxID=150374 RepID=A0A0M8N3N6_ESCWE|nr:Mitochondrial protein cyt-4 [Escovopsis weberi]
MTNFRLKSESTYQANLEKLDAARHRLPDEHQARHMTLTQIAEELLPESLRKDGSFPAYALYAVHTALSRNEMGFRPLNPSSDCRRPDNLIEIFSKNDTAVVEKVALMLREYSDRSVTKLRPPHPSDLADIGLGQFLQQARKAVLASREKRQWTSHGILRPSPGVSLKNNAWTRTGPNKEIIDFLEWWASHDVFEPGSRFHNYGALILRALHVYDVSVCLDQSTAWTLLQEIGVIAPWELPSRYKVRFPGVTIQKGGGLKRPTPGDIEESRRQDIASGARREHAEGTIFCIDAPSTVIIDDGVSLERTNKPGEFWIHVHAADPASSIEPNSGLYNFMSLIPENIYLPGHFQAMLPAELGEDDTKDFESQSLIKQFSLKSGSPALTFSAKVNEAGDVLDFKVEPSRLGSVVYIDPKEVAEFCNEPAPPPVPARSLTVGKAPKGRAAAPNRPMIAARDLDRSSKEDLRVMYRLAEAIRGKRLQKGAWPYFFPGPSVSVSFPESPESIEGRTRLAVPEDPFIKVSYETSTACSIVSNFMVLAGEIAARWCSSRSIPIPYRRDIRHAQAPERARDYAAREIYPLIARGVEPSFSQRQELSRLTGGIELSSRPGPYFLLGLDMYAKATSPLRRFSDLLVHWQVHAALRHERETGRAVDPAADDLRSILPFFGPDLDDTLALLQMREKMARTMSRGVMDWILMALVRAWRFEGSAPKSLRFTVSSHFRQALLGRTDLFGLNAIMDVERLGGLALLKDVRVGDQFQVELADVNVHSRQILVKALKYLGAPNKS